MQRLLREAPAKHDICSASLPIALERIARDRSAEEQQIVEMRQLALRAGAADVVDAGRGCPSNFGNRIRIERRRETRRRAGLFWRDHHSAPSVGVSIVDVKVIEP